jgi:hypothetical protein
VDKGKIELFKGAQQDLFLGKKGRGKTPAHNSDNLSNAP